MQASGNNATWRRSGIYREIALTENFTLNLGTTATFWSGSGNKRLSISFEPASGQSIGYSSRKDKSNEWHSQVCTDSSCNTPFVYGNGLTAIKTMISFHIP